MQRNKQHITSVSSSLQCGIILALMIGLATPLWALDRVLVCTQDSDEVLLYENDAGLWTFLSIFTDGSVPVDGFALDAPNGIAVSPDGSRVYISESITSFGRVLCYAADGTFIKTVAEDAGSVGNGEFDGQPYHLEFGPDGRLYLSTALDGTTERIYALDVDTNDVSIFVDTTGTGYSLNAPLGFTFVGDDLYVACRGDDADTIDSPGGDEILVFEGPAGSSPGALLQTFYNQANKPKDVFFDSLTGNLFFGATAPNVFLQFTEPGLSDANMPLAGDLEPFEIIRSEGLIHYTANDSDIVRLSADGSSTTTVVTGLSMSRGLAVLETISPTLWDGGGANDNLSTPENWIDDVAPDFGGALVSFSGAARLTPNNDVINAVISHLSFTDQADAFTLGGNGFTLSKRLSNNSTATQTIATAEIDAANASIQANAGNIDVSAPLYLGAASTDAVSIGGPYTTTLTGALGGSGGLTIDGVTTNEDDLEEVGTGGSTLAILTNNGNNYSGPTNINAGVLRIDNPSQLGATSSINVATNEYATRLEIDGGAGMTISKPMNFIDRSSADLGPEDAIVNNLSGDNILSGPLTFTSDGNGNSFLFRMDAGSLTLAGEAEFTGTYGSLRSDGAGTLIVPFAFTGARSIIPRGSSTMRLTNVENTYTTLTRIVEDSTLVLEAASTNNIPNTNSIMLVDPGTTLDVTGLNNGEIVLTTTPLVGGVGTVVGGLVAGAGHTIEPGTGNVNGTLTFTNGLTLNDGVTLLFDCGKDADVIRVSGGTLTGSASPGGINLVIESVTSFPSSNLIPLIDFSGATLSDFDLTDLNVDLSAVALPGAEVRIEGSQLVLDVSSARFDLNADGAIDVNDWLLCEACLSGPDYPFVFPPQALLYDNMNAGGANSFLQAQFDTDGDGNGGGGYQLGNDIDFAINPVTINFDTIKSRTGGGKNYRYRVLDASGNNEAFRLIWYDANTEWAISTDYGASSTSIVTGGGSSFFWAGSAAWNPAVPWRVDITCDASGFDVTIVTRDGSIGSVADVPIREGVPTLIGQLQFEVFDVNSQIEGIWLDNILVTADGIGTVFDDNFDNTAAGDATLESLEDGIASDGVGSWYAGKIDAADAKLIAEKDASICTFEAFQRMDVDCDDDVDMADFDNFGRGYTEANTP